MRAARTTVSKAFVIPKFLPETVISEFPVTGLLLAEREVIAGASYVNEFGLQPTFSATVMATVATVPVPAGGAHSTIVVVIHEEVLHAP
jgi:hypothetical protein